MCGIVGFVDFSHSITDGDAIIQRMSDMMIHRGPDDGGIWCDSTAGIYLGHRRLSISDLSSSGAQPLVSQSGRYAVIFNGEIYNHLEIRTKLKNQDWKGHSDTETIAAMFDELGVQRAIEQLIGMFAIGVFDRFSGTLHLIRDRLGEKPLYYGWLDAHTFGFASELKALRAHPKFLNSISRHALSEYCRLSYVPSPLSIFSNIFKLAPGHSFEIGIQGREEKIEAYWSADNVAVKSKAKMQAGLGSNFVGDIESHLLNVVRRQMVADVPLGSFLSGGIDSSLITAMMQSQSSAPIQTFTIGFDSETFNEAPYARDVARHLGTSHHELIVDASDAFEVIPKLPVIYDEPFADSSQIPTYLVSALAKEYVTVALSGDGGDELFGGYHRYFLAEQYWGVLNSLPMYLKKTVASLIESTPEHRIDELFRHIPYLGGKYVQVGYKLKKLSNALRCHSRAELYNQLISFWPRDSSVVILDGDSQLDGLSSHFEVAADLSTAEYMMLADTQNYLPDEILVKVDRAAMAVSLETRAPFLDHELFEMAWTVPIEQKIRSGNGKLVLREILSRYVPASMFDRPKMGFGVPLGAWLRGPLKDWVESLIEYSRLKNEGYFCPEMVRSIWMLHLQGRADFSSRLWIILMFQSWLGENS